MKKIFLSLLILLCASSAIAKDEVKMDGGYVGSLPDVTSTFQHSIPVESKPLFESEDGFNINPQIKPVPRDNAAFVNIIMKKDKTSEFINDINDIIPIVEKLSTSIENNEDNQKFSAKVNYLNNNVDYLRRKYEKRSESQYISFRKLMELNLHAMSVSTLRTEGQIYSPYLAYSDSGYIYNPNNIEEQLQYLLDEIQQTVVILKETN